MSWRSSIGKHAVDPIASEKQPRILIFLLATLLVLPSGAQAASRGIVVEEARPGGAADQAGITYGDLLLTWWRDSAASVNARSESGEFLSPLDLSEVEFEQASRGPVRVQGRRGGEPFTVTLPPGRWGLEVRPQLLGDQLETYAEARRLLAAGDVDAGLARSRQLIGRFQEDGEPHLAVWITFEIADALLKEQRWGEARATLETAVTLARTAAESAGDGRVIAQAKERFAALMVERSAFTEAAALYRQALRQREASPGGAESVGAVRILTRLGRIVGDQGHFDEAQGYLHRALEIGEQQVPGSLVVAETRSQLAVVHGRRSDMAGAMDNLRRAVAIQERLAPRSPDLMQTLNRLGLASRRLGDLVAAAEYFRRAVEIQSSLDADSHIMARLLNNLGVLALKRGDLAAAEEHFWRAWELSEAHAPRSLESAASLSNLGSVFESRGDLDTAARYHRRALEIVERLTPESPDIGLILDSLGNLAFGRHDLDEAERHYRSALALRQRKMPDSLLVARSWRALGGVAIDRGDFGDAGEILERALAIERRAAPGSLELAHTLGQLGEVATLQGRLSAAEPFLLEAFSIHRQLAPGTRAEAISCQRLATLYRRLGQPRRAREFYALGTAAFEDQEHRLGGSYAVRSGFAASRASLYGEYVDFLVEGGEVAAAFHVLERSRNRAFLEFLGQRDLSFAADVPPELERQRRLVDARYNDLLGRLARLSADRPEAVQQGATHPGATHPAEVTAASLRRDLRDARHEQQEIKARIQLAAPRVAALRYSDPLDLAATQQVLDPGTLLLAYALGEERGHLFAIGPDEARVFPIPMGAAALREEVRRLHSTLRPSETVDTVHFRAARLSDLLLAPVADKVERAERLLILPDGPLHTLPFAALAVADKDGGHRYLVELQPVTVAASATVFAELRKQRREIKEIRLSAFGDPLYPAARLSAERPEPVLRTALELGLRLDPLPATRTEIEGLRVLFPENSHIFLGAAATEERAKALAADSNAVHFACHGVVDARLPLESALVLSLPNDPRKPGENGLLQVWEIFEQMRIDADLVTLSACDTALGQELAGEGILGLARAFQYAGARSVLASLWGVNDASTAQLMEHFYGAWKRGRTKDEALRDAQLQLIRSKGAFAHPFYWAAFKLIGDWR